MLLLTINNIYTVKYSRQYLLVPVLTDFCTVITDFCLGLTVLGSANYSRETFPVYS